MKLSWISDSSVTSSTVEYGLKGFTLGTGTRITAGPNFAVIVGLTPDTICDIYVQHNCPYKTSKWSYPRSYSTHLLGPPKAKMFLPLITNTSPIAKTAYFDASPSFGNGNSYKWLFGDGDSASGLTVNHTYSPFSGTFEVTLIVENSCGIDTTIEYITIDLHNDELAFADLNIDVYPNPSSFSIKIDWKQLNGLIKGPLTFEIYTLQGQKVKEAQLLPQLNFKQEIDISDLNMGNYIIRVHDEKQIWESSILSVIQ